MTTNGNTLQQPRVVRYARIVRLASTGSVQGGGFRRARVSEQANHRHLQHMERVDALQRAPAPACRSCEAWSMAGRRISDGVPRDVAGRSTTCAPRRCSSAT